MSITNPNGANQYQQDPRQRLFWEIYLNPKAKNFSNAYQTAQEVGYTENTAATITTEPWFQEKSRRLDLLSKAEKVLKKTLDYETDTNGESAKVDLLRVQTDVAKFVASRLGKDNWSDRTEMTGANGDPIIVLPAELIKKNKLNAENNANDITSSTE